MGAPGSTMRLACTLVLVTLVACGTLRPTLWRTLAKSDFGAARLPPDFLVPALGMLAAAVRALPRPVRAALQHITGAEQAGKPHEARTGVRLRDPARDRRVLPVQLQAALFRLLSSSACPRSRSQEATCRPRASTATMERYGAQNAGRRVDRGCERRAPRRYAHLPARAQTYKSPRRPFEAERLDAEMKLVRGARAELRLLRAGC